MLRLRISQISDNDTHTMKNKLFNPPKHQRNSNNQSQIIT